MAELAAWSWPTVSKPVQIIVGKQTDEDMQILGSNRQGDTMGLQMWLRQPVLICKEESKVEWATSVHRLPNAILHIVGGGLDDTNK